MEFKDYSRRINSVIEFKSFGQAINEKHSVSIFCLKKWNGAWINWKIQICTNDERYYFSDRIVLLPFSHPFLHEIIQFKNNKNKKIEAFLLEEKTSFYVWKKNTIAKSQRLSLYITILQQNAAIYHFDSTKGNVENHNINFSQTTRSYILHNFW